VSSLNRTEQRAGRKVSRNVAALMVFEAATLAVASGLHLAGNVVIMLPVLIGGLIALLRSPSD
jgi:hypothetical protein